MKGDGNVNCCEKLAREIRHTRRFTINDTGLYINFKDSDYDEDYGYATFTHRLKIDYCPFCGEKVR
jgi:hypothetical protein